MARIFGLSGRITGRKGDAVFSVRKGEQIVRQYNPMVLNPNTEAQTVQRSKMKLSSQLGAVFANVIAIPSDGAKTTRNIFTKINFPLITRKSGVEGIVVEADLPKIQLTNSGRAMSPIAAGRMYVNSNSYVSLLNDCANEYDRVVYTIVAIEVDGNMRVIESHTVSDPGKMGRFSYEFPTPATNVLIYAYGIKDLSSKAYTTFADTTYNDGTAVAELISGRQVSAADAQVSKTVGLMLPTGVAKVSSDDRVVLFVETLANANCENTEPFFAADDEVIPLSGFPKTGYHVTGLTIEHVEEEPQTLSTFPYYWPVEANETENWAQLEWTVAANA